MLIQANGFWSYLLIVKSFTTKSYGVHFLWKTRWIRLLLLKSVKINILLQKEKFRYKIVEEVVFFKNINRLKYHDKCTISNTKKDNIDLSRNNVWRKVTTKWTMTHWKQICYFSLCTQFNCNSLTVKFEGGEELFTRFVNSSKKTATNIIGIELVVQFVFSWIVHAVNMHQCDTWPQTPWNSVCWLLVVASRFQLFYCWIIW